MKTIIYGASDDLIEIEGQVSDEIECYEKANNGIKIESSDGTKGKITYQGDWVIEVTVKGFLFQELVRSVGDEGNHTHEDVLEATSYSDVLILGNGVEWVKIGRKKFTA